MRYQHKDDRYYYRFKSIMAQLHFLALVLLVLALAGATHFLLHPMPRLVFVFLTFLTLVAASHASIRYYALQSDMKRHHKEQG